MVKSIENKIQELKKTAETKAKKKYLAERRALKKDISMTFATSHGMRTLRWLMNQCGYQTPSVTVNRETGELLTECTIYNEARRGLYLDLRQLVSLKTLIKVENQGLVQDEEQDIFN